jgi:hypothetical protein
MTDNDLRGFTLPLSHLPVGYEGKITISARSFKVTEVFPTTATDFVNHIRKPQQGPHYYENNPRP